MIPQCKTIPQDFQLVISDDDTNFALSTTQTAEIDRIWKQQQETSHLFNGQLFSVTEVKDDCVIGKWIEYKYMIAQRYSPSLQPLLKIASLGISSVTICSDAVLVGRRGETLANYPNFYECAPSGGVDPSEAKGNKVDAKSLILKELEEEVGLTPSDVLTIEFSKLYFDPHNQAYELIAKIALHPDAFDKVVPTMEYPEVFWLKRSEILPFLKLHKETILPLTQVLLMGEHL